MNDGNRNDRERRAEFARNPKGVPQRLKPRIHFSALMARLKPCPYYKACSDCVFRQTAKLLSRNLIIGVVFSRGVEAGLAILLVASVSVTAQPSTAANAAFDSYVVRVEARLNAEHRSAEGFLGSLDFVRLRRGELTVEQLTSGAGTELPGALLHDWRGAAFIPGGTAIEFERVMKDFGGYPRVYAPQVVSARVLSQDGDHFQVAMRVRQKHVLTVVMDTTYDVRFGRADVANAGAARGYSLSRSTKISEIDAPGTAHERALAPGEEHGFLWRMNTYWSYEERDGGLYIEIESVSLSRSIPVGLGWAVGPFVESVPRESLEFTLNATRKALSKRQ